MSEAKAKFANVVTLNIGWEMNRSPEEIVKLINKELVGHSDIVKVVMLLEWYECTYSAEKYARNVSHVAMAYLMKNLKVELVMPQLSEDDAINNNIKSSKVHLSSLMKAYENNVTLSNYELSAITLKERRELTSKNSAMLTQYAAFKLVSAVHSAMTLTTEARGFSHNPPRSSSRAAQGGDYSQHKVTHRRDYSPADTYNSRRVTHRRDPSPARSYSPHRVTHLRDSTHSSSATRGRDITAQKPTPSGTDESLRSDNQIPHKKLTEARDNLAKCQTDLVHVKAANQKLAEDFTQAKEAEAAAKASANNLQRENLRLQAQVELLSDIITKVTTSQTLALAEDRVSDLEGRVDYLENSCFGEVENPRNYCVTQTSDISETTTPIEEATTRVPPGFQFMEEDGLVNTEIFPDVAASTPTQDEEGPLLAENLPTPSMET